MSAVQRELSRGIFVSAGTNDLRVYVGGRVAVAVQCGRESRRLDWITDHHSVRRRSKTDQSSIKQPLHILKICNLKKLN